MKGQGEILMIFFRFLLFCILMNNFAVCPRSVKTIQSVANFTMYDGTSDVHVVYNSPQI